MAAYETIQTKAEYDELASAEQQQKRDLWNLMVDLETVIPMMRRCCSESRWTVAAHNSNCPVLSAMKLVADIKRRQQQSEESPF